MPDREHQEWVNNRNQRRNDKKKPSPPPPPPEEGGASASPGRGAPAGENGGGDFDPVLW